jgi:hypothetical protein
MHKLRIGVTGHRWTRLSRAKAVGLERAIAEVLVEIDQTARHPCTLVCGMAEGTDLLAASCRPSGWGLEAVLPLPIPAWRAHLAGQSDVGPAELDLFDRLVAEARVVTLPPVQGTPDYVALADHLATTCDPVLAVWDGAKGWPGGTADVLRRARARGVAVRVIDAQPFLRG